MKIATKEEVQVLKPGQIIFVDVDDKITTMASFIKYDEETDSILTVDCTIADSQGNPHYNICEYKKCFIPSTKQMIETCLNVRN
jgi:hypothetical protein